MMGGPPLGTLEAPGRGPAVLALHGFGATTQEVGLIVDIARNLGLAALAPLLPGHGTSVLDLARTRFADWRGAAERALLELVRDHGRVIVVGSSMGSLIALDLAADFPEVVGVGVLGCPIRLRWPYPSLALAAMSFLRIPDFTIRKTGPDILDPEARRTQVTYSEQPAHAGNDLRLAGRRVEGRLGKVSCPAFVAHGRADRVCPVNNARIVHAKLGTSAREKELLILERSHHIITRDVERGILRTGLSRFIERVAARSGERQASSLAQPSRPVAARGAVRFR
jgi:carboxylesterase